MCMSCVAAAIVEPVVVTEGTLTLVPLIRAIYDTEWGSVGGPLHVYLDDFNLEDHWFETDGEEDPHDPFSPEILTWHPKADIRLCRKAWDALRELHEPERYLAVAIAHGDLPEMQVGETFTPPAAWTTRDLVVPASSPGPCPACGTPLEATFTGNGYRMDIKCPAGHYQGTMIGRRPFDDGIIG